MEIIQKNRSKIFDICKNHNVLQLHLFGSILNEQFSENSDIDMLIQFGDVDILEYFDNYMSFIETLEKLLKRRIDLVENQAIRNPVFRRVIDRDKKLLYERKGA